MENGKDNEKPCSKEFIPQAKCKIHDSNRLKENGNLSKNEDEHNVSEIAQDQKSSILKETEVISPDLPVIQKGLNKPIPYQYLQSKLESMSSEVPFNVMSCVDNSLKTALNEAHLNILSENLTVNQSPQNITKLMPSIKQTTQVEENIKLKAIKELKNNKHTLESKLNKIDDKVNLLQLDPVNSSKQNDPSNIVESNIKKDQMKLLQENKAFVSSKIQGIEDQINRLLFALSNENESSLDHKKHNIQKFLDNFSKDQEQIEQQVIKYQEEKKNREAKLKALIAKSSEKKFKEMDDQEKEIEEMHQKKLELNRKKEREKIVERLNENNTKMANIKQYTNSHPNNETEYLFKALEKNYKLREEKEINDELIKRKRKNNYSKEEIDEFTLKQREREKFHEAELEEEKRKLKEQWKKANDQLPKFENSIMQKIKQEENKNKEEKDIEEIKKKAKQKEIKNYSETVNKLYLPKINDTVRKQREETILNLVTKNNNPKHVRKNNRILLVKPDPSKPRKYKWDSKLDTEGQVQNTNTLRKSRSKSAKQRKPLSKPKDYLTEIRLNKEKTNTAEAGEKPRQHQWNRIINDNKHNFHENVEMIKIKAKQIEEKAKMAEQKLKMNKGEQNYELQDNISNMLIDAIKAKLAIIDSIHKK